MGILIFKRLTARRLYNTFGVKGLIEGYVVSFGVQNIEFKPQYARRFRPDCFWAKRQTKLYRYTEFSLFKPEICKDKSRRTGKLTQTRKYPRRFGINHS
jgi:hypothetical protein